MKCVMTFRDGEHLTAVLSGAGAGPQPVRYSGAVDRVKTKPPQASPGFLEWYFKAIAVMTDAELVVDRNGHQVDLAHAETAESTMEPRG